MPDESPAAKQQDQFFAAQAADHAADAIVIVTFQKFGEAAQRQADASYADEMGSLFAEGGHEQSA